MKTKTSFGFMETILERDGEIISELMTFNKEGRGHSHYNWEHCFVVDGEGIIVVGEKQFKLTKGDVCKIPPNIYHWMIPSPYLEILIVYSSNNG